MLCGCGLAQEMLKKLPNVALMVVGWPFRVVHAFNGCRGGFGMESMGRWMVLIRLGFFYVGLIKRIVCV